MGPPDHRLIAITLDEQTISWRSADVEQERRVAIFDLLESNHFAPLRTYADAYSGPFRLFMRIVDGRLVFDIQNKDGHLLEVIALGLTGFRKIIRDYFAICETYYRAIRESAPSHIETIDMARRGVHNEGATFLMERLADKIELDFDTARRLFTLICVLHIRGL